MLFQIIIVKETIGRVREIDIGSEIEKGREIKREGKRIKVKTHLQKLEQNIRKIVKTNKKQSNMWC